MFVIKFKSCKEGNFLKTCNKWIMYLGTVLTNVLTGGLTLLTHPRWDEGTKWGTWQHTATLSLAIFCTEDLWKNGLYDDIVLIVIKSVK